MKVLAINGSPRKDGNCADMLEVLGKTLEKEGIEFEVLDVGTNIKPCLACYHCMNDSEIKCIQDKDCVNEALKKVQEADGIVLASPVYHGGYILQVLSPSVIYKRIFTCKIWLFVDPGIRISLIKSPEKLGVGTK